MLRVDATRIHRARDDRVIIIFIVKTNDTGTIKDPPQFW
jgi:hypothetical protein